MKLQLTRRRRVLVALVLTLILLVLFGLMVLRPRSANVTLEPPPCKACEAVYSSSGTIPTIGMCELETNSPRYANQTIRVKAVFVHDAGQTYLRSDDGKCQPERSSLKTGLDTGSQSCADARKALSVYSGFETWYDSQAKVIVVGRIGRINNPLSFFHTAEGFNILCLERVEPFGSGDAERRKYESWVSWLVRPSW